MPAALTALVTLATAAGPLLFTSGVEPPQKSEQLTLPPKCALCAPGKVTCTWYPSYMVKEIDLGEIGADVLSIVPRAPKGPAPACKTERGPNDLSVSGGADPWVGYFEGARGRFAFFRSADARNGVLAFAVYDATDGRGVFKEEPIGPVKVEADGAKIGLSFIRRTLAPCSPLAGGDACWTRIRTELGVGDPPPDCATPYREANETAAKAACANTAAPAPRCVEQELRLRPAVPAFVPPALEYEVQVRDLSAAAGR